MRIHGKSRQLSFQVIAAGLVMAAGLPLFAGTSPPTSYCPLDKKADSLTRAFYQETCLLAGKRIKFDDEWLPPGESQPWVMDCSNTIRYLFKKVAGVPLPRRASEQYLCLQRLGKVWDIPDMDSDPAGRRAYLRKHLKPGDLLFWENTCFPYQDPPVTHVMIFLGRNEKGKSILAGSQTGQRIPGLRTGREGGADIYIYDPTDNIGGYVTPQLIFRVGHLQAYGRPLEANAAKLAEAVSKL